jgi:hypothetical protein
VEAFTQPTTIVTLAVFVLGVPTALYLAVRYRRNWVLLAALFAVLAVVVVTFVTTDFPGYRVSFGGDWLAEIVLVVVAFAGIVFGILAHIVYYRGEQVTLAEFLKPLVVSPLLIAPLVGVMETTGFEVLTMLSLFILAFQNGFFWKEMLKNVRPTGA